MIIIYILVSAHIKREGGNANGTDLAFTFPSSHLKPGSLTITSNAIENPSTTKKIKYGLVAVVRTKHRIMKLLLR